MGWSATEAKRSGAFVVEIVEKASQVNKFMESIDNIKDNIKDKLQRANTLNASMLHGNKEMSTRTGMNNNNLNNTLNDASMSGKDTSKEKEDNILRPGDYFRLRSVKFPNFELGLTSVKLRDEYCYLGLRKVSYSSCIILAV